MNTSEALRTISERLMRENICSIPLSERSLQIVYDFMRLRNANSELMRRLSTVELNYVQIHAEADDARKEALGAKQAVINSLKDLLDIWHRKGYLREFSFGTSSPDWILIYLSIVLGSQPYLLANSALLNNVTSSFARNEIASLMSSRMLDTSVLR